MQIIDSPMTGLMQDHPLQVSALLRYAEAAHPGREIVSRQVDGSIFRYDNRGLARRAAQAANMLRSLGIVPGDVVSSLAWNTHRHLELFYAVPGIGAVLHTANPRLSDDHVAYTIDHAGSRVLLIDESFVDLAARLLPRLGKIETVILLGDRAGDAIGALSYEALLRDRAGHRRMAMADGAVRRLPVLHVGHDGRSQGRALQPSLDRVACLCRRAVGRAGLLGV